MAYSYVDRPALNCPECGRSFSPEIWLIIDTAERPELLARVRDGTIHHVVCPNGHAGQVDAPLLLYRPGQTSPLLFSPAQQTTAEQDQEVASTLLSHLALSLGDEWRDEWLEQAQIVPSEVLPAVLAGADSQEAVAEALSEAIPPAVQAALAEIAAALQAEGVALESPEDLERALEARPALQTRLAAALQEAQAGEAGRAGSRPAPVGEEAGQTPARQLDPLRAALQAFVEAETWFASYRTITDHPELLDDATDTALMHLIDQAMAADNADAARIFLQHLALLRRAREVGAAQAFAEKMETTAEELEAAVAAEQAAETIPPAARQAVQEIVAALRAEGVSVNSLEELEAALEERPALRARLAAAEQQEAEPAAGAIPPAARQALEEVVAALRAEGVSVNSPEELQAALKARPELAARLAAALGGGESGPDVPPALRQDIQRASEAGVRYRATGNPSALDGAVAAWERVLNASDFAAAPERFQLAALNDAAIVFIRRYQLYGRLPDLDRALALWQGAVARTPADSPDRAAILNNLGTGLSDRYARTGQPADLEAAIIAFEDAVACTPADSPNRPSYLNNLGNGLSARYTRTGDPADLDAAIKAHQDTVARISVDSPEQAIALNNLGTGLRNRYDRTGDPADLDAAIDVWQEAVTRTPSGSPNQAAILNNLGGGLRARYVRTGQPEDLDAAIAAHKDAVARTASASTDRARRLNNLGIVLSASYARAGKLEDLDAAIAALEDAVTRTPADAPDRAGFLNNLGNGLSARYKRTGQPEDLGAAITAYREAVARTPVDSPDRALYQNNLGNGLHDQYVRTSRSADLDAAIAAWEDAVARAPADSPDRAGNLGNLGNGLRDRYARTGQPADLDAAIAALQDAVARTPANSPERAGHLNNLGNGLSDRYERTGQPTDLDAAIAALQDAVARTPADSPDRAGRLNNLGAGLSNRYVRTGDSTDQDAAIKAYEEAVAALDRALLDSPVAFVLGQQEHWAGLYARTVDALAAAGRAAAALAAAEGSKSRLLAGLVGRGELAAPAELPADLVARERALAGQLNAHDAAELARRDATKPAGRPVADRAAIVLALRAVWDEMAGHGPAAAGYLATRRGDRLSPGDLARLAGDLGPGAALLSLYATAGRTRLFLWRAGDDAPLLLEAALDADELRYNTLPNYAEEVLGRAVRRDLSRPLTHRWRRLGHALLGPLRPHLAGINHLVVAPESLYHLLPLHALWLGDAGDTLLDHCAVSYVPALSLLHRLRQRGPADAGGAAVSGAAVLGAAVFGYTPADTATEAGRLEQDIFLGEAVAVARRLGVAPRLDGQATGAALEAATAAPLRLLHLSCHGYFDPGDALRSGVLLADGVYTARQFIDRRLPAELVTLSACQTGLSGSLGGDEMAGLSLALLTAGASSLLLGLWSVNAVTTAVMMDDFYGRLWKADDTTTGKAQALRQTMLALRDGQLIPPQPGGPDDPGFDPADPYYWAPFALIGDWR